MDANPSGHEPAKLLQFYCRDCKTVFEAAPDGSGYEQTPCPACREMCLTVEFEQEEQRRNAGEAGFASFLSGFLGFVGIPHLMWVSRGPASDPHRGVEQTTLARYESPEDAELDVRLLADHGIRASVVVDGPGETAPSSGVGLPSVQLQVPTRIAFKAGAILRASEPSEPEEESVADDDEEVLFPCEECGAELRFPGDRRGKVDVCRHCGEFVDVPERF